MSATLVTSQAWTGLADCWQRPDVMMSWYHDAMMPWCHDIMMSWCHDAMMSWCHDPMMSWCHDVMMPWCHDVMMSWCLDVMMSAMWNIKVEVYFWQDLLSLRTWLKEIIPMSTAINIHDLTYLGNNFRRANRIGLCENGTTFTYSVTKVKNNRNSKIIKNLPFHIFSKKDKNTLHSILQI